MNQRNVNANPVTAIEAEYVTPDPLVALPEEDPKLTPEQARYLKVKRTRACPNCGNDVTMATADEAQRTELVHDGEDPKHAIVFVCMQPKCTYAIYGGEQLP